MTPKQNKSISFNPEDNFNVKLIQSCKSTKKKFNFSIDYTQNKAIHFKKKSENNIATKFNNILDGVIKKVQQAYYALSFKKANSINARILNIWYNYKINNFYNYFDQIKELELMLTDETSIILMIFRRNLY